MAELVFRNTDGRTYTYDDQNDLYRVLNETYDSKSGSADFSWFHFSGGDNRIVLVSGAGEGMNVISEGQSFHLACVSSETQVKVLDEAFEGQEGIFLQVETSDRMMIERLRITTLYRCGLVNSVDEGQTLGPYSIYSHSVCSCENDEMHVGNSQIWFPLFSTSVYSTYLSTGVYNKSFYNGTFSYLNNGYYLAYASSIDISYSFSYRVISGYIDANNLVYDGNITRSRNIEMWDCFCRVRGIYFSEKTYSDSNYKNQWLSFTIPYPNGALVPIGNSKLNVTTYTRSYSNTLSMTYVSLPEYGRTSSEEYSNMALGYDGISIASFTKSISETVTKECVSMNSELALTSTFIDSIPVYPPWGDAALTITGGGYSGTMTVSSIPIYGGLSTSYVNTGNGMALTNTWSINGFYTTYIGEQLSIKISNHGLPLPGGRFIVGNQHYFMHSSLYASSTTVSNRSQIGIDNEILTLQIMTRYSVF